MKKKHFQYSIFLILLASALSLLFSCKESLKDSDKAVSVTAINTLGKTNNIQSLLELFDLKQVIELKTDDSNLIGKIKRIRIVGDNIFIFDNIRNTIYRFNANGEFLNCIGKKGGGPEEFIHAIDFVGYKPIEPIKPTLE